MSLSEAFKYVSWQLSDVDLDEELEDLEGLAALERAGEDSDDSYTSEAMEEEEVSAQTSPHKGPSCVIILYCSHCVGFSDCARKQTM